MKVKDVLKHCRGDKIYIGQRVLNAEGPLKNGHEVCVIDPSWYECRSWSGWRADAEESNFKVHRNPKFDRTVAIILPTTDGGICICYKPAILGRRTDNGK